MTHIKAATLMAGALALSACSEYQITLNETVVRDPIPLYTDFRTTDRNLQTCIDQAIKDQGVTNAGQLTQLICSHAGIETLEGLEAFHNLEQINLSDNQLQDIAAFGKMGRIKLLLLANNRLKEAPELLTLPHLERLDVSGNASLNCDTLSQLGETYAGELHKPEHCG